MPTCIRFIVDCYGPLSFTEAIHSKQPDLPFVWGFRNLTPLSDYGFLVNKRPFWNFYFRTTIGLCIDTSQIRFWKGTIIVCTNLLLIYIIKKGAGKQKKKHEVSGSEKRHKLGVAKFAWGRQGSTLAPVVLKPPALALTHGSSHGSRGQGDEGSGREEGILRIQGMTR